jgi:hypothetical protein
MNNTLRIIVADLASRNAAAASVGLPCQSYGRDGSTRQGLVMMVRRSSIKCQCEGAGD